MNEIPLEVRECLERSDVLVTEIVIDQAAIDAVLAARQLPEGQTIRDRIPAAILERAERFVTSLGASIAPVEQRKIWSFRTFIGQLEDRSDPSLKFLDQAIHEEANRLGLPRKPLESVQLQLDLMQSFPQEDQIRMLESELAVFESKARAGRSYGQDLIEDYISGECDRILQHVLAPPAVVHAPELREGYADALFYGRNAQMVEKLVSDIRNAPGRRRFVAIGVGHLVGSRGVVQAMRDAGFTVTRVSRSDQGGTE